jgi:hypothetical protein
MLLQKRTGKRLLKIFLFNLGIFFSSKLTDNIPTSWLAATIDRQPSSQHSFNATAENTFKIAVSPATNDTFADGIYFYGQSAEPERLGKEYLIFQVKQDKIKGAFFQPQSEYDCLQGTIDDRKINLSIEDGEGNNYSYPIAIDRTTSLATNNNPSLQTVNLQGYQPILQIPTAARELLATCLR